jgi:hypothetical protein
MDAKKADRYYIERRGFLLHKDWCGCDAGTQTVDCTIAESCIFVAMQEFYGSQASHLPVFSNIDGKVRKWKDEWALELNEDMFKRAADSKKLWENLMKSPPVTK